VDFITLFRNLSERRQQRIDSEQKHLNVKRFMYISKSVFEFVLDIIFVSPRPFLAVLQLELGLLF